MSRKHFLVTGGTGFLGAALVRRLVQDGHRVRVLDNNFRGNRRRLGAIADSVETIEADIRDEAATVQAAAGVDCICHLAFINGTRYFYTHPEFVLDVGVRGMLNVLAACRRHGTGELIVASSSEVYQMPPQVPTDETVPLSVPDPHNPRYSYGAGKLISEILTINQCRTGPTRAVIFRPHNVYGPDMGWEHVIPEFSVRMSSLLGAPEPVPFPIQGNGEETRAFVHIDDFVDGLMLVIEQGSHLGIYNIGTEEEVSIRHLAEAVGACFGRRIALVPGPPAAGGTRRRCPDITRSRALGYAPKIPLKAGLPGVVRWYTENRDLAPATIDA